MLEFLSITLQITASDMLIAMDIYGLMWLHITT